RTTTPAHVRGPDKKQRLRRIRARRTPQTSHDRSASRRGLQFLGRNTFFLQYPDDVFCGGLFVARRIGCVDFDQVLQPDFRVADQRCQVTHGRLASGKVVGRRGGDLRSQRRSGGSEKQERRQQRELSAIPVQQASPPSSA